MMHKVSRHLLLATVWITGLATLPARGADAPPPATQPAAPALSTAILDFDANFPGNPDLGKQISECLTATLSGETGFTLVDRASMNKTITEHETNLTGLVDQDKAIKIGHLVGAKILVMGRAFMLDKTMVITAKLVGTETTLVDGLMVKGKPGGETADLVVEAAEKITQRLKAKGATLVASEPAVDPFVTLKDQLANKKKPVLAIEFKEQHISQVHVIDPPVDTELRKMFTDAGFTVVDAGETNLNKAGVGMILKGEALSEFGARIGNINSCTARVELQIVKNGDNKTLLSDRETARAADLSENIAAKSAMQKAARNIGLRAMQYMVSTLPADDTKK